MSPVNAFLRLVRLPNILLIALSLWWPSVYVFDFGAWVGESKPAFSSNNGLYWLMLLSSCTAAAGYIINDYFDREIDAINRPDRPSVSFYSPKALLWIYTAFLLAVAVCLYFFLQNIGWKSASWAIWFFPLVNFSLFLYAYKLKCTALAGNILVAILCALLPISLLLSAYNDLGLGLIASSWLLLLASFAFFATFIREIVKDIEDLEGDRVAHCTTFAGAVGVDAARTFAFFLGMLELVSFIWFGIQAGDMDAFMHFLAKDWHLVFFIFLPLLFSMFFLWKNDFHKASNALKIHLFFGILLVPLF